jgi:hypothetical protein
MQSLKGYKMQGRAITISWAAGKGVKSKEWKDYWDIDLGEFKFFLFCNMILIFEIIKKI